MLTTVRLVIPGDPQGKGRPNYSRKIRKMHTPKRTSQYEQLVEILYRQACGNEQFPKGVPLDMRIKAYFPIARSNSKKLQVQKLCGEVRPTVTPDWDNIGKIVCDALNGVAYYDDCQIVDAQVRKFYSDRPRVEITITKVKENQP